MTRRRVPLVQQTSTTDCGAACLTMVLRYHGRHATLDEVRRAAFCNRDGTDALDLLRAAQSFGLAGRGLRIELDQLARLRSGSILHWQFRHFVVFERLRGAAVTIVDPALGRRHVSLDEFSEAFTGVVLDLEPGDSFETRTRGRSRLLPYLARLLEHRGVMLRILVTSFLLQGFALVLPVFLGVLIDRVVPRGDFDLLLLLGLGALTFAAFQAIASFVRLRLFLHLQAALDLRMTLDFLEHLFALPFGFFQSRPTGDLLMRIGSNVAVRQIVTTTALSAVLDGSLVGLYLVLLCGTSLTMGALVLGLGLLRVGLFLVTRARRAELISLELQRQSESQSYQVQMLGGIQVIKAGGTEDRVAAHWGRLFVRLLNASLARGRLNASVDAAAGALGVLSPLAVLLYGTSLVMENQLTLGTMLALNALAAGFLGPLSGLVNAAAELQTAGTHLERIADVLESPREQELPGLEPRLEGRLTLDSVGFSYGPGAAPVLHDVSFEIEPGEFVALVGGSGAGKSTVLQLAAGLYRPTSGRILYDGIAQDRCDLRALRRQIGVVPQHTVLFGTSLADNIALADPALPMEAIVEAARLAAIHDEILELPMGYDTLLDDRGSGISGGQRQRLALARALVRRPVLLLLDEATSELDPLTERKVRDGLAQLRSTRLVIAHRLGTIRNADRILVLDHGRLVEQGTHEDLLAREGVYAALVAAAGETRDRKKEPGEKPERAGRESLPQPRLVADAGQRS